MELTEDQKQAIREVFGINPNHPIAHWGYGSDKIYVMFTGRKPTEYEVGIKEIDGIPIEVRYVGEIRLC